MLSILSIIEVLILFIQKGFRIQVQEGSGQGSKMLTLASEFLKLKYCLEKTVEIVTSALRGAPSWWGLDRGTQGHASLPLGA